MTFLNTKKIGFVKLGQGNLEVKNLKQSSILLQKLIKGYYQTVKIKSDKNIATSIIFSYFLRLAGARSAVVLEIAPGECGPLDDSVAKVENESVVPGKNRMTQ
jgi:hypothetical protein